MKKIGKIKILSVSNWSKAKTGFGNNHRNILMGLFQDPRFEIIELSNGARYGSDLKTPWKSYGTYPNDPNVLQQISNDPQKERLAAYGNYTIDEIVNKERPDIVLGIEDIWAFDWVKKPWFDKLNTIIWTTLDSLPILDQAYYLAPKVNKFLVWASFAEKEMKFKGYDVETLHGAINYSSFKPLENRDELRKNFGLEDQFVVGFVFKNQLRKSVPNLLEGFKSFQEKNPNSKLLLHTDWKHEDNTWDIPKYIKEKGVDPNDVLATYVCQKCKKYVIAPFKGEDKDCPHCNSSKTLITKNNMFGVTEIQLNEIYNLMDVYCHPFTSGGQELPIQEAKSAGLITLVTEYSCGLDSCQENKGGIPLKWAEYREPLSNFVKASTLPSSICDSLQRVKEMSKEEKKKILDAGQKCIQEDFSTENIINRLKEIFLELGKTDWDFDTKPRQADTSFIPDMDTSDGVSTEDWLIDVYKKVFDKNLSKLDVEIKSAAELVEEEGRGAVFQYIQKVALEKNSEINSRQRSIEEFFDGEDEKRIAVVMPESAGDVLIVNSLLENLKKTYPEYNIYFITKPAFYPMVDDNPAIKTLIPYQDGMDNLLLLEGRGEYKGLFDMAFIPHVGSQKFLNYMHNGKDVDSLRLKEDLDKEDYIDPYLQTR